MTDVETWAAAEFSTAELGDKRRGRRLVHLAAEVARRPAGTVTRACSSSASREGAFRWLENHAIRPEAVAVAAHRATLQRCANQARVYVAVDATSLTLTDETESKGLGAVGSWAQGSRGVHVMTAFAIAGEGTPLGVCGQQMWVREQKSKTPPKASSSDIEQRETRHWLELLRSTHEAFGRHTHGCEPFYQLDRGADCWPLLALAIKLRLLLTVRAAHDRRVDASAGALWRVVERAPVRFKVRLKVAARSRMCKRRRVRGRRIQWRMQRAARVAALTVRAAEVPLILADHSRVVFNAVLVREHRHTGDDRIEWLLLTTHSIKSRADVRAVVRGYTQRWRIEEFHRTWKRGLCRVEDTQLRSRQAVFKWGYHPCGSGSSSNALDLPRSRNA